MVTIKIALKLCVRDFVPWLILSVVVAMLLDGVIGKVDVFIVEVFEVKYL